MDNIDLKTLTRNELIFFIEEAKTELKRFRPYRIKERLTQCGNVECWCDDGDDLHGPYLYASYRKGGKTKQVSLGPKLEIWEMVEAIPAYPDATDYLFTPNHKYEELPVASVQDWMYLTLSGIEFQEKYGCSKEEDNFDRADKFWGSREDYQRYQIDVELREQMREVQFNKWSGWGVGNLKAIAVLTSLESQGYYQKG